MTEAASQILIVEDHPTMREAMRMVLEHEGFAIREAADGAAALEMIRAHHPDLVFLDLNIPGTSGAEVLQTLKGDPETAQTSTSQSPSAPSRCCARWSASSRTTTSQRSRTTIPRPGVRCSTR
jgi:CheY-like chemotaxis protein